MNRCRFDFEIVEFRKTPYTGKISIIQITHQKNIQDIFMVSIYAKVVVNLQIRPEEHLPGNDQSFRMISWKVSYHHAKVWFHR